MAGRHGDAWKVRVAAPPERGRANAELVAWLASVLGVGRDDVSVIAGASSRRKIVQVAGVASDDLARRLERAS